jgi:GntR family transcriptional regulator of vanillate catabolism
MASLIERVTAELRRLVLAGELAPGERVVELELASRLEVSRTPLRLAFGELEREGLFERLPKRGFRVRQVTLDEVAQAIDVRGALEGLAARTAAESGVAAEWMEEMRACVSEGRALVDAATRAAPLDTQRWVTMNVRFHRALMQAANNPVLAATMAYVAKTPLAAPGAVALGGMRPALELAFLQRAQSDHEDIVQAIEAREGARAEALLREHARRSRDNKRVLIQQGVEVPEGGAAVAAAERALAGRALAERSAPLPARRAALGESGMG